MTAGASEPRRILGGLEMLADLGPGELAEFQSLLSAERYADRELICQEGQTGDRCYFIIDGGVRVEHQRDDGIDLLATLEPGSMLGLLAIVDGGPRSADCRADGSTLLFSLTRQAYLQLIERGGPLSYKFQDALAREVAMKLRHANQRLADLAKTNTLDEATAALRAAGDELHGLQ